MKKTLLTMVLGAASLVAGAQIVEVESINKVPVQGNFEANYARISPDGSFVIASTLNDNSLHRVDVASGATRKVVDNGSALHISFTPDGSNFLYRTAQVRENKLRYYSVQSVEIETGYTRNWSLPARHCANFTVTPAGVVSVNAEGRYQACNIKGEKVSTGGQATVGVNHGHLEVTMPDGTTTFLDPQGRGSYLWPSLSPDGTKIAYFKAGSGAYVCDLDGSNVRALGNFHAPAWLGNDVVLVMDDKDNGEYVTAGAILAMSLDGKTQRLTSPSVIALNPWASLDGKHVSFTNERGEIYVINLK